MYPAKVLIRVAAVLEDFADRQGCWEWTGARSSAGRAVLSYYYRKVQRDAFVHVAAYLLRVGAIPEGQEPAQACGNGACINPKHLVLASTPGRPLTAPELATSPQTGPMPKLRGAARSKVRLDAAAVAAILASTEPAAVLAARYGVSSTRIGDIRNGRGWRHVPRL